MSCYAVDYSKIIKEDEKVKQVSVTVDGKQIWGKVQRDDEGPYIEVIDGNDCLLIAYGREL